MERMNLADAFERYSQDADGGAQEAAADAQSFASLRQLAKTAKREKIVKDAVKANTTEDPTNGQIATNHAKVVQDLYLKDPEAAEQYQKHVEDMQAEKITRQHAALKTAHEERDWENKEQERQHKIIAGLLATVDTSTPDAEYQYNRAVAMAKEQGVDVEGYEKYDKHTVDMLKKEVIGAGTIYKEEERSEQRDEDNESRETIARIRTKGAVDTANIRAGAAVTTAMIRTAAKGGGDGVRPIAVKPAPSGNGVSFVSATKPGKQAGKGETVSTIDAYMGSHRGGGLSKGGEITLRTDPEFKRLKAANFEKTAAALTPVIKALEAGDLKTGPGRSVRDALDRSLVAARNLGLPVNADSAERRVTSYDALKSFATDQGIAALAGIGGNDTDKDFDRALDTTVGNLKTGAYNIATAKTAKALLEMGRDKIAFYQKFANMAGSPNGTVNGMTFTEAWTEHSRAAQQRVARIAEESGLYSGKAPAQKKPFAPKSTPVDYRIVNGPDGKYRQYKSGKLEKVK